MDNDHIEKYLNEYNYDELYLFLQNIYYEYESNISYDYTLLLIITALLNDDVYMVNEFTATNVFKSNNVIYNVIKQLISHVKSNNIMVYNFTFLKEQALNCNKIVMLSINHLENYYKNRAIDIIEKVYSSINIDLVKQALHYSDDDIIKHLVQRKQWKIDDSGYIYPNSDVKVNTNVDKTKIYNDLQIYQQVISKLDTSR